MSATNRGTVRKERDYYATPEPVIRALFKRLDIGMFDVILDPCCGDGRICRIATREFCADSTGFDIQLPLHAWVPERTEPAFILDGSLNALEVPWPMDCSTGPITAIVTNPPYSLAMEFVQKALSESHGRLVCMLLPLSFLSSKKRAEFHKANPSHLFVLDKRPSFTNDGKTDAQDYAWFAWNYNSSNSWEILSCAS